MEDTTVMERQGVGELHWKIQKTTDAVRSYRIESYGKAIENQALIASATGLMVELRDLLLPSGTPCTRCSGSGIEPTH